MSSTKYKLIYFDGRGRAEICRLCFAAAGVPYEDYRVEFAKEWPELKKSMPLGSLPVLEVEGKRIPQSFAIARYLGRQFGLMGSGTEEALIDSVLECMLDLRETVARTGKEPDKAVQAKLQENLSKEVAPTILKYLSNLHTKKDGFLFGNKMTVADLAIFDTLDKLQILVPNALDQHQDLKDLIDKVAKEEKIAKWLANRPQTVF